MAAQREVPGLKITSVPPDLQVAARYGVAARQGDARAAQLLQYMVSPSAQAVLQRYGFGQP